MDAVGSVVMEATEPNAVEDGVEGSAVCGQGRKKS